MKIIFLLFLFLSLNTLFSQNLSVKWENFIEGDTSIAKFVQPVNMFLDKNENGFIYLFNSLFIKSILKISPTGTLDYHNHQYFFAPFKDETFKRSVSQSEKQVVFTPLPTVNALRFSEILTISNNEFTPLILSTTDFGDTKDAPLVTTFPNVKENDYMLNPKVFSAYRKFSYLCYYDRWSTNMGKILHILLTGVIHKRYDIVMDSILQEQRVVDGVFDSTQNSVTVLSGNERIYPKGHFSRGKYQEFQIRRFNVNLLNDSLEYVSTITISPNQMKDTTLDYSPIRLFEKGDYYYVIGNTIKKNFQYPFIAKISKSGIVNDVWVSDSSVAINSATFSADSSNIAFCGYTNSFIGGTKYYSFNVCEFDLNSKEFIELTYSTDMIDKKLTSIQAYKNGDYAVTGLLAYPHTGLGYQPSYAVVARITHSPTSVGDMQPNKTTVKVTPNPSTEMATVEFMSSPEASTIQLVDIKGNVIRTLYQKTTQNTHQSSVTFRVSDLANGMYYVIVRNGIKTLETVPLSIQR